MTATAAGGTHPTGMHSCFYCHLRNYLKIEIAHTWQPSLLVCVDRQSYSVYMEVNSSF